MNAKAIVKELTKLGTAQNRKIYARHGAAEPILGVSYADLYKLQKRLQNEHALALELWQTGIHDARTLASLIADADQMKAKDIESWLGDCDNYGLTDAVAGVAARAKGAEARASRWMKSKKEWTASAGWNVLGRMLRDELVLASIDLEERIAHIESHIGASKNRVKHNMNYALIAIGTYVPKLKTKAIAAAKRIGKVDVDHGVTSCKTPDAAPYIAKSAAHLDKKKKKAAEKLKATAAKKKTVAKKKTARARARA